MGATCVLPSVATLTGRSVHLTCLIWFKSFRFSIRTEVRGDFNIHGTKSFLDAVFHQKSKIYDVLSLLYLLLAKQPILYMKY